MKNLLLCLTLILGLLAACQRKDKHPPADTLPVDSTIQDTISTTKTVPAMPAPQLNRAEAKRLAALPLACLETEFPNKLSQVLGSTEDLGRPKELHPAFYGCFDWHSAVHGHWSLVKLLKQFPDLEEANDIRAKLKARISKENILQEVAYFEGKHNKSYERTYGWAWLLKLAEELYTWEDPLGDSLATNLAPLTQLIVERYLEFLPKLRYPLRIGTHTNTGFGLAFAYDYAQTVGDSSLQALISKRAKDFFLTDKNGPIQWEPGGYDFLSPCLEEVDIMRRVLDKAAFKTWLQDFLPALANPDFQWAPGEVSDRQDGHLVHLDGVNFSRAWCLYGIANTLPEYQHLRQLAHQHIHHSLPEITDGHYEGGHWLASFAIYALSCQ